MTYASFRASNIASRHYPKEALAPKQTPAAVQDSNPCRTVDTLLRSPSVQHNAARIPLEKRELFLQLRGRVCCLCLCGAPHLTATKVAKLVLEMPRIEHFCADNTAFDNDCLNALAPLTQLKRLSLQGTRIVAPAVHSNIFAPFPNLTSLDVTDTAIRRETQCLILALTPTLDEINGRKSAETIFDFLIDSSKSCDYPATAGALLCTERYQALAVSFVHFQKTLHRLVAHEKAVEAEKKLCKARHFDCSLMPPLFYTRKLSVGLPILDTACYEHLGRFVHTLTLPQEALAQDDLKTCFQWFSCITHLDATRQAIYFKDAKSQLQFLQLIGPLQLRTLHLKGMPCTPIFLKLLAKAQPHLQQLSLIDCNLTDDHLKELHGLKELTHLHIPNNPKISDEGFLMQMSAFPKLTTIDRHTLLSAEIVAHSQAAAEMIRAFTALTIDGKGISASDCKLDYSTTE